MDNIYCYEVYKEIKELILKSTLFKEMVKKTLLRIMHSTDQNLLYTAKNLINLLDINEDEDMLHKLISSGNKEIQSYCNQILLKQVNSLLGN